MTETPDALSKKFIPFGAIESVRVMRVQGNGYVNFCSIESAVRAREAYRGVRIDQLFPEETKPDEAYKELQVTFTTAQQNCRRPRLTQVPPPATP